VNARQQQIQRMEYILLCAEKERDEMINRGNPEPLTLQRQNEKIEGLREQIEESR
jgi:hypothetical protein